MPVYTDQLNREVNIPATPKRIISLVPSQTELLAEFGLDEEVAGITKFCVHPETWFRNKTRVGGTKTVKTDLVGTLQPDLIIANKEENVQEQIALLEKIAPVWVSDINTIDDALEMIKSIGQITNKNREAKILADKISIDFQLLSEQKNKKVRTSYLIWKDPYMAAGGDTFISDVLRLSAFENVFSDVPRYPSVTIEMIKEKNTELVLLSSEPYPFKQKHIDELRLQLPGVKIICVDGEIFSWYGSRMKYVKDYVHFLRGEIARRSAR
jgi:ABC-type Fe3+-hydroxamate transport system substrate-binding protein